MTQEKHLLFLCFHLFCRVFWIFFFLYFPCYPPLLQIPILLAPRNLIMLLSFSLCLSHILYCYQPLPLNWALTVLWSFPFLKIFFLLSFFFLKFNFLNILCFSTFIPFFAFPTVLFPLQLILNAYKSSSSTSVYFAYLSSLSFLSFLSFQYIC